MKYKKIILFTIIICLYSTIVFAGDNPFTQIGEWADVMKSGIESAFSKIVHLIQQIMLTAMYFWFFLSVIIFFSLVGYTISLPMRFQKTFKELVNFARTFLNITEL